MTVLDEAVPVVGRPNGDADLRVYNVVVCVGYVESARHATLTFRHLEGFEDARAALLHLHDSILASLKQVSEWGRWTMLEQPEYWDDDPDADPNIVQYIEELQKSDNDQSPGGHEMWEEMCGHGWECPGELVTGICVTLYESGEYFLASKPNIERQWRVFNGEYIPKNGWYITGHFDQKIVIVSKIPSKPIKKPGE